MKKIVIDTNVLVSASIATGYPYKIIKSIIENNIAIICVSAEVISEYERVLLYERIQKKYPHYFYNASDNIRLIKNVALTFKPTRHFSVIISDVTDNIFLDLAAEANADYLITGNHLDFTITEFENTKIISPKTFCELYDKGQL